MQLCVALYRWAITGVELLKRRDLCTQHWYIPARTFTYGYHTGMYRDVPTVLRAELYEIGSEQVQILYTTSSHRRMNLQSLSSKRLSFRACPDPRKLDTTPCPAQDARRPPFFALKF